MKHLKLFFALFAVLALGVVNAWAEEYALYSGTITEGDYVIVYNGNAMNNTVSSSRLGYTAVTITGDKISNPATTIVWHIAPSGDYWTIFSATVNKYAASTGAKNKAQLLASGTDNKSLWTVTGSSTYEFVNKANETANVNKNLRQNGTYGFACYATSTGGALSLYKKVEQSGGGETTEPEPEPDPDPTPDPGIGGESGSYTWDLSKKTYTTGTNEVTWTCSIATMHNTGTNATNYLGADANNRSSSRFYNGNTLTITPASNISISSVVFIATSTNYADVLNNSTWDNASASVSSTTVTVIPTNGTNAISAKVGGTCGFTGVTVHYTKATSGEQEPEKTATSLVWSQIEYAVTMGEIPTFPTLTTTPADLTGVTYSSSNGAVATIAEDGTITIKAAGETTIKASYAGNETYAAATDATYKLTVNKAPANPTDNVYVKVTSDEGLTNGEYLVVYEDETAPVAFDGSLTTLDAAKNTVAVGISNSTIAGNTDIDAALFTIDLTAGTLKSASGKYIGVSSNNNGLKTEDVAKDYKNAFSIDDNGNAVIAANFEGSTMSLRYNKTNDATSLRFRYYKNAGQQPIALYKKASSHAVTIASCENGSVSASVANGAKVLSGTTVTLENTPAENYKLAAYDVYKTGEETTKVTFDGNTFVMPEFDVTISATFVPAKTLTGIEITNAATQTTFWQGETFNYDGLKVTAHFNGAEDEDVTSKITVTGSTATASNQTVTVSYTEGTVTKSTSYEITVKAIPNTKETAYSVADAYGIIDKLTTATGVFITGTISQVDSYNSTYKSITYWISADGTTTNQLQVYSGKGLESADFAAVTDLTVGDKVIVCGDLKKYNSTYEFDKNNYLAEYTPTTKDPAGLEYATTSYTANVGEAFATPTLTNPNNLTVTYSTSDAAKATVDASTGAVTIVAVGKVTITASTTGDATHDAGAASYNITISDPSLAIATLPFYFDGKRADIEGTAGMTQSNLGTDYAAAPYLKFNAEGAWAIVQFDSEPGEFSFLLKQNGESIGTFTVYESENGEDYTPIWSGGDLGGNAKSATIEPTLSATARYVKFEYTTKPTGTNYGLGEISIKKADHRQEAGLVWNPATVSLTVDDAFTAPTLSNPNNLTGITFASDNTELVTVNAGVISLVSGKTGTATITATYAGNEFYKAAEVTCVITVSPKSEKVVILAEYNGQWYALKNAEETAGKVLAALPVSYVGGKLYNVTDADKATIEWQLAIDGTVATFKNGENYISGTAGSADMKLATTECEWTYDGSSYMIGNRTFLYRAQANGFKNYNAEDNAGTADYSALPVVTAPVYVNSASALTGKFSTGKYEYAVFAPGNLQYNVKNKEWSFAKQQYQYIGDANINVGDPDFTGTIDMFGWSNGDANNFGVNPSCNKNLYVGEFVDWGNMMGEGWLTLTDAQWNYLLNERTNASKLKQIAMIGEIRGIMLFPDEWTGTTIDPTNDEELKVDVYKYDLAQWADLEAAGAVFLPAAGRRFGGYGNTVQVTSDGKTALQYGTNYFAAYWTSTKHSDGERASYLINLSTKGENNFVYSNFTLGWYEYGHVGQSVRLAKVTDITPVVIRDGLTIGQWGTLCPDQKVTYMQGASFYTLTYLEMKDGMPYKLFFDEITTDYLEAGKPYLFIAEGEEIKGVKSGEVVSIASNYNGFYGNVSGNTISLTTAQTEYVADGDVVNYYGVINSRFTLLGNGTTVAHERAHVQIKNGQLDCPNPPAFLPALAPGARRVVAGATGINTATGVDQVQGDEVPTKMIINGQLFILRGEKMYDAQGKLVK